MKFDDSEYYFLDFETELPNEAGAIPIGYYFVWAMQNNLLSPDQHAAAITLRAKQTSCADLVLDLCDGKLTDQDFNALGLSFTQHYHENHYIADYAQCFGISDPGVDALCSVADSDENLRRLGALLDQRFAAWRASPQAVTQPAVVSKPTGASIQSDLRNALLPLFLLDGFVEKQARTDELIVQRQHGSIRQQLRLSILDAGGRISVSIWLRFGCAKLRKIWLALLDPKYRADPPALFSSEFHDHPDLEATDLNFSEHSNSLLAAYLQRFGEHPQRWVNTILGIYQDHLREALNAASDAQGLARIAQCAPQMNRQRNHPGYIKNVELLARIVLLGTYSTLLSGATAPNIRAELLKQFDRDIFKNSDFPLRGDIERLLDAAAKPEFAEKARAFLQA